MEQTFEWQGDAWPEPWNGKVAKPDSGVSVAFAHNGDYRGNVKICLPSKYANPAMRHFTFRGEDHHIAELYVPFAALEALVLKAFAERFKNSINSMSNEQLAAVCFIAQAFAKAKELAPSGN